MHNMLRNDMKIIRVYSFENGKTPDDYAFAKGHLNLLHICEFIPEWIEDQNLKKKVLDKEFSCEVQFHFSTRGSSIC